MKPASENLIVEHRARAGLMRNLLHYGIQFLDDALIGIMPHDLILLGAPSGSGKTELCRVIAMSNIEDGKRVAYLALEAEDNEIERRIRYNIIANLFFKDQNRPTLPSRLTYVRWALGQFLVQLNQYEQYVNQVLAKAFANLSTHYKKGDFKVGDLVSLVNEHAANFDLLIIDHVHYFDFDDDNENRAIKQIAKATRDLALEFGKPIILVAHLRKRDRHNSELVAGLDEFMGSSDLYKIATKAITIAPGEMNDDGQYETFIRIPKNRHDGGSQRIIGRLFYDPKNNQYSDAYQIGPANCTRESGFKILDAKLYPDWARYKPPPQAEITIRTPPAKQSSLPYKDS